MTEDMFLEWISSVWKPHAAKFKKTLLILDLFSVHKIESVKKILEQCKTDLLYIPAGLTSKLQPLDLYVNKPL